MTNQTPTYDPGPEARGLVYGFLFCGSGWTLVGLVAAAIHWLG